MGIVSTLPRPLSRHEEAMTLDVFFTGLMLLCLNNQQNCQYKDMQDKTWNTAWILKADDKSNPPCGRPSPERTKLELTFKEGDFKPPFTCVKQGDSYYHCPLPDDALRLVISQGNGQMKYPQHLSDDLQWLPKIDEIDTRFKELDVNRLKNPFYVPGTITFPDGDITAGTKFPELADPPTQWFRSNGKPGGFPRPLSDRLRVRYDGSIAYIEVRGKWFNLHLEPMSAAPRVWFRNGTEKLEADHESQYDDLSYLLWYYRLGVWKTTFGTCPDYKDAVVLRCIRDDADLQGCAYSTKVERDNTIWPPLLGPIYLHPTSAP